MRKPPPKSSSEARAALARTAAADQTSNVNIINLGLLKRLDQTNPARSPVWYADQGAIVELLNGRRSVKLPEVVS
jgi:hypothetical protein